MPFQFNDLDVKQEAALLQDIQGNILRGFGKLRTIVCFLRFPDATTGRKWVGDNVVKTTSPLAVTAENGSTRNSWLVNFALTKTGLERLGCLQALMQASRAFQRGSRDPVTRERLNDLPLEKWDARYRDPWDAMLLVAFDPDAEEKVKNALSGAVEGLETLVECGNVLDSEGDLQNDLAKGRFEPFGYQDGLSQLYFLQSQVNDDKVPENPTWDPRRPWSVVLAPDPLCAAGYASYFVVRKLRQDVPGFNQHVADLVHDLADQAHVPSGNFLFKLQELMGNPEGGYKIFNGKTPTNAEIEELVLARIVGRTRNGRVDPSKERPENHAFDYADDQRGSKCPFYAHMRKMNRRGDSGDPASELRRVIARRGMPYGKPADIDRGMLFICAQSDIAEQFEFLQQTWANDDRRDFNAVPNPGPDQLIAQPKPVVDELTYDRNRYERYASTVDLDFRAYDFVSLRGAEYLVAPSLSGLKALANGEAK